MMRFDLGGTTWKFLIIPSLVFLSSLFFAFDSNSFFDTLQYLGMGFLVIVLSIYVYVKSPKREMIIDESRIKVLERKKNQTVINYQDIDQMTITPKSFIVNKSKSVIEYPINKLKFEERKKLKTVLNDISQKMKFPFREG